MSTITQILRHLSPRERAVASLVCKEWAHAAEHPSLWETLDLSNDQHADVVLSHVLRRPPARRHLRHLKLEFAVGVDDTVLRTLDGCSLVSLNLNACQKVTDEGVALLLRSSPDLESLSLYWILNVSDATLAAVAAKCTKLAVLNLSGCKRVTDEGVAAVAAACSRLRDLDLTRCVEVTDDGVEAVAANCRLLRVLRLYANSCITDMGCKALSRLHHLQVLDLTGAHALTSVGVRALAACGELRELVLTWCIRVGDPGVIAVAGGCRKLEVLSLHGLRLVTDKAIDALAAGCAGSLHTLDVSGCTGIERRDRADLTSRFLLLRTFVVHT